MATFLASPTTPEEIAEYLSPDQGVLRMMWRTRAVVNNIGFSLKDVVDNQNKASGCMNTTFRSMAQWDQQLEAIATEIEKDRGAFRGEPGGKTNI